MGLLAGSTVTLLTIIWRTCTVVGKCDIHDTIAEITKTLKASILKVTGKCLCDWMLHFFSLTYINVIVVTSFVDFGVNVDVWTICLFIVVFSLTSSTFNLIITRKWLGIVLRGMLSTFIYISLVTFWKWFDYWVMLFFENHRMQWLSLCGWWTRNKNL